MRKIDRGYFVPGLSAVALLAAMAVAIAVAMAAGSAAAAERTPGDLEAAREELRLRVATERRMREEFETLLAGGRMSADDIADFESYLTRLGVLVDAQRRAVAELEGRAAPPPPAALPADFDRGRSDDEKLAMLDAQLGRSLSEFDDKLLREQKEIAEKSRSTSASGEAGASEAREAGSGESAEGASGDASEGRGERAGDEARSGEGQSGEGQSGGGEGADGDAATGTDGREAGEPGADGNERVASAGGESSGGGGGGPPPPPDIPDGADDDVVARQLREAAENEEDPELRAKLWEEYRKYKQGTR